MRTPLSKVRGNGSAKDGTGHFWHQRLTALANIPLIGFFYLAIDLSEWKTLRRNARGHVFTFCGGNHVIDDPFWHLPYEIGHAGDY